MRPDAQKVRDRAFVEGRRAFDGENLGRRIRSAGVQRASAGGVDRLRVEPRAHDVDWIDDRDVRGAGT